MITISSNIDDFLKAYRKRVEKFKEVLFGIAEKLATRMATDMAYEITSLRSVWEEEGNLDEISNFNFDIQVIDNNSVRVLIGSELTPLEMEDGTLVNPIYFIEFGFGIVGQQNPKKNHEKYDWEYNINQHNRAWYYYGKAGQKFRSKGREGINFMYNTIEKYRTNWQEYFKELMEQENG
jgi:hypothetical protein